MFVIYYVNMSYNSIRFYQVIVIHYKVTNTVTM